MGRFIEGEHRHQVTLLPDLLDDYISEDSPVRIVEAFVEELDLLGLVIFSPTVIPSSLGGGHSYYTRTG